MQHENILHILHNKSMNIDCTEAESAEIKGWLKDTIIQVGTGEVKIMEDIQHLFPIEYGGYLEETENKEALLNTGSMQRCTEAYNNAGWVMATNENIIIGFLRSLPFETLGERIKQAIDQHFDEENIKIESPKELADEIHELKIFIPTDIEDGYNEIIELTPAWEY